MAMIFTVLQTAELATIKVYIHKYVRTGDRVRIKKSNKFLMNNSLAKSELYIANENR